MSLETSLRVQLSSSSADFPPPCHPLSLLPFSLPEIIACSTANEPLTPFSPFHRRTLNWVKLTFDPLASNTTNFPLTG